ncbi:TNFAIP3-interacting protein 1 isoform X2 [Oxyura jamaicensis]|uniref:TNFAIP3-interacting protein 1 isoform X2 n=1 Tax=Oxyura jamaicensis TaxID=8884 RepID=UPI0015A66EAE|nr:TNFAIP3-interacting protein 1 isoform X2 [Oxyura jamaicensis]
MGYMASELKRLASKVHKNEQRTSFLQTLCETLHTENKELRTKLERDLEQRNQALEKLRCENQELRRMVTLSNQESAKREAAEQQQSGAGAEKALGRGDLEAKEKKVKILEHQRRELLEVNKQWDQHFRAMKQKYEQKMTDVHQELAEARRALTEMEVEREQKQRDFDRKLLLAKSRIETEEAEKDRLAMEVRDLQQRMRFLQEQLAPVTRQREYQEKEIQRLNKALEEALNVQASPPPIFAGTLEPAGKVPQQELLTQNELLKQQVKIFEEDFQRERSDRERMNEEKEELKQQLEKLQKQLVVSNNQLRASKDDCQREKEEKEKLKKMLKQHKQASGERLHPEPLPGPLGPACPMYQYQYSPPVPHPVYHGFDEWQQIRYPPAMPGEHAPGQNFHHFPPPEYPWRPPCAMSRSQNAPAMPGVKPVPKDLGRPRIAVTPRSAVAVPCHRLAAEGSRMCVCARVHRSRTFLRPFALCRATRWMRARGRRAPPGERGAAGGPAGGTAVPVRPCARLGERGHVFGKRSWRCPGASPPPHEEHLRWQVLSRRWESPHPQANSRAEGGWCRRIYLRTEAKLNLFVFFLKECFLRKSLGVNARGGSCLDCFSRFVPM